MATDSASTSRNLWQIPTFLVGAAALISVWYARPYWQQTPAQRYERDLTELRQALDKIPVEAGQVQALLRKVYGVDPPAQVEKASQYVIGSALIIVAEATQNLEEAQEQWKTARRLLEQVDEKGLPANDRGRLQHRLAKTWVRTGEPPWKVIEALTASLNCGDDPSEGNRLLAELYLKLDKPDEKKARDCLREYLSQVVPGRGESQQRQLTLARLQLGELSSKLGDPEEARRIWERIGPDAPADLLLVARRHLAKSYLSDEEYSQAIRCLEQARDLRGITPAQKGSVLYDLADAYHKAGRKSEALAALEQLRKGNGAEAQAAAFRFAEWQLNDSSRREAAVEALETAVSEIKSPSQYDSKLLSIVEIRNLFEDAAVKFRTANAFDASTRVARAYGKIAEEGRDQELAAEALQAWGQTLLDKAPKAEPEDRPRFVDEGTKRLREAAKAWAAAASAKKKSVDKGDLFYRAADLFLKTGDLEEALKMLDEIGLKVPDFPAERLADVWLKKGEVYAALGNREQARICFQNGIQIAEEHPSPALLKCRIRLAEVLLKSSDPKTLARALVDLEKALADPEFAKDRDLHESALYFVADAYYQQRDFSKAEVRYRSLLDNYPDSPRAVQARFMLAQSYWFIAGQEADRCKTAKKVIDDPASTEERKREAEIQYESSYKQYMEWLKKAAEPFKMVEAQLLNGMANPKLPPDQADLLRKSSLAAADCSFFSGDYDDCVTRYDLVASRYAGTVVQLEALRSQWRCYQYYLQKTDKALDVLTQMRTAFVQMPASEFDNSNDVRSRDYWQKWFDQVAPMKK